MHSGKQRSVFNVYVGPTDHSYGYYRCMADFVKRCVNQALLNALKIIDNMVCRKCRKYHFHTKATVSDKNEIRARFLPTPDTGLYGKWAATGTSGPRMAVLTRKTG